MINIAICDDEKTIHSQLTSFIKGFMEKQNILYQIFAFENGNDLLESTVVFDIIFLDIQMNGLSGIETAKKLRTCGKKSFLVFVTILKEYVFDAFEVEASDYLIKPIYFQKFCCTMNRILKHIQKEQQTLLIQKGSLYQTIKLSDIFYFEAMSRKVFIHTNDGIIDYYNKIDLLQQQLNQNFFRCHRSYLVHLQYVNGFENDMAVLTNGEKIPVSRLRRQEFMHTMMTYLKKSNS